jgi:hypothetical protein
MKALSATSAEDATKPETSTLPWGPIRTPFGLMMRTWPFASRLPSMVLTWPEVVSRFSVSEVVPGWMNFVV